MINEGYNLHSAEDLRTIFASQGDNHEQRFFPFPASIRDLEAWDGLTLDVLRTTDSFSYALNQGQLEPMNASVIGGVACAAYFGHIYRKHHDVDILIAEPQFTQLEQAVQLAYSKIQMEQLGDSSIYRCQVPVAPEKADSPTKTVQVDLFVYQEREGLSVLEADSYPPIVLSRKYPIVPSQTHLLGFQIQAAPFDVIKAMKELDARAREKGHLDIVALGTGK